MKKFKVMLLIALTCSLLIGCGSTTPSNDVVQSETTTSDETVASSNKESNSNEVQSDSDSASSEAALSDAEKESENAEIDNSLISNYTIFDIKSDNLHDGKWDDIISYTDKGQNHSPQLSWEPVEGASSYMIYMVDTSMEFFIHWKSNDISETTLSEGWASEADYIGPYPPAGGTHTYEVYVLALKNPVDRMKGGLNGPNKKFPSFLEAADTDADGNTGNIVGAAHIGGTFTY